MEPTEISNEMLKTEEGQLNAVYACFGAAAQHAQHFEVALAEFLVTYNTVAKNKLTVPELDTLHERLGKRTMGVLLRELKKYVTIDHSGVDDCLEQALEARNFLMHRYFREREQGLSSESTRLEMMTELVHIGDTQETAATFVRAMRIAFSRALENGVHQEENTKAVFSIQVALPD